MASDSDSWRCSCGRQNPGSVHYCTGCGRCRPGSPDCRQNSLRGSLVSPQGPARGPGSSVRSKAPASGAAPSGGSNGRKASYKKPFPTAMVLVLTVMGILTALLLFLSLKPGESADSAPAEPDSASSAALPSSAPSAAPAPTPALEVFEYTGSLNGYSRIAVLSAEASSELAADGTVYTAAKAIDNSSDTCWIEAAPDYGPGEYISCCFGEEVSLRLMSIHPGFKPVYYANCRPRNILITLSDGSSLSFTLKDENCLQFIAFSRAVSVSSVTISIVDVYRGDTFEDTCISNIEFYT